MHGQRSAAWVKARATTSGGVDGIVHAGFSMMPALRPGDLLSVRAVPAGAPIRAGAVLIAADAMGLVAHRVVRWDGSQVVLRGDANRVDDPPRPWSAIVGEVSRAERGGRAVPLSPSRLRRLLAGVVRRLRARGRW